MALTRKETYGTEKIEALIRGFGAAAILAYAVFHNGIGIDDAFTVLKAAPELKQHFDNLPEALKEAGDLDLFEVGDIVKYLGGSFTETLVQIQALQESYSD